MKKKISLVAAIVCGIVASVCTRFYLSAREAEISELKDSINRRYGTMDVLCFYKDTPSGTPLTKNDLATKTVPAIGVRGQALTADNVADILGRKTLITHRKGDILFWADIEGGDPSVKGLSADIKKSMRAVSINCSGAASVSSMVRPNDHVDVIGTFDFDAKSGKRDFVTCTILQNVLVLATGNETAKAHARRGAQGLPQAYSTVTLEVTPREAEMLAFANEIKGRLVLSLRNGNDTSYEKELPKVDFEKIRGEIEELNLSRQQRRLSAR